MQEPVKPKRQYKSAKRSAKAARTQRAIIEASRRLFLEQGYVATTITSIAEAAGVSAETVYNAFGTKRAVLARLIDVALAGDYEDAPVLARHWVDEVRSEPDQRRRLRMLAHTTRTILERAGPIHAVMRSAAAVDPEIESLRRQHRDDRLRGQVEFVLMLAEAGPLREGLSIEAGGELYWALASPEMHYILTVERGWSHDRYENWLFDALGAQLLPAGF